MSNPCCRQLFPVQTRRSMLSFNDIALVISSWRRFILSAWETITVMKVPECIKTRLLGFVACPQYTRISLLLLKAFCGFNESQKISILLFHWWDRTGEVRNSLEGGYDTGKLYSIILRLRPSRNIELDFP